MAKDDDPLRDFSDRFFRKALMNAENLRDLLMDTLPALAEKFDFSRMREVKRDFTLPNWRRREVDLLFEIPFRSETHEQQTLVCLLIEHQTRSDPRMPLRMLLEIALYWDRQWLSWEEMPSPKSEFRLTPVLPIVLHTGGASWSGPRSLTELLGPPPEFHSFTPNWTPLFWEVSKKSADELLNSDAAFLQIVSAIKMEDADRPEFERYFQAVLHKLNPLHDSNRVRWAEMIQLMFGWVFHRRPREEFGSWCDFGAATQEQGIRREELRAMAQLTRKSYIYETLEEKAKATLIRLGRIQLQEPDLATLNLIQEIDDIDRIDRMTDRVLSASSWREVLETL